MNQTPSPFFTAHEVAEILRVTVATVYRLIDEGEIPGIRIGRSRRIPRADFIAKFGSPPDEGEAA